MARPPERARPGLQGEEHKQEAGQQQPRPHQVGHVIPCQTHSYLRAKHTCMGCGRSCELGLQYRCASQALGGRHQHTLACLRWVMYRKTNASTMYVMTMRPPAQRVIVTRVQQGRTPLHASCRWSRPRCRAAAASHRAGGTAARSRPPAGSAARLRPGACVCAFVWVWSICAACRTYQPVGAQVITCGRTAGVQQVGKRHTGA